LIGWQPVFSIGQPPPCRRRPNSPRTNHTLFRSLRWGSEINCHLFDGPPRLGRLVFSPHLTVRCVCRPRECCPRSRPAFRAESPHFSSAWKEAGCQLRSFPPRRSAPSALPRRPLTPRAAPDSCAAP
jgi:hypothetical protein